jgi:molybdopterin converting factor subunit 1
MVLNKISISLNQNGLFLLNYSIKNMKIQLLFFGITTDLTGENSINIELTKDNTIQDLKAILMQKFPKLKNMHQFAIAVNEEYAEDTLTLKENDVVAIIPPVSGG